jgi:thioredoxin-related protein
LKKITGLFILALVCHISFAQSAKDSLPNYKLVPAVPPFKLFVAPDSTVFTKDQLKKRKATIIMVFSPDCDHCVHATEDLITHYNLFKKVQIIMATSLPYEHVSKFYTQFKLTDYPNIKVGWDANYFLGTFYEVRSYPAIFLYDKKGKFKQAFDANTKWETIAAAL